MVRLLPAAIATVLGLFGCGPATLARGEFLSRGNAICAAAATRIAQLARPGPGAGSAPERMAGYVDAYVAELRQELANLRRIGYPAGERGRLRRAYDAVDAALTAIERDPLSFRRSTIAPAAAQLVDAGLTACRE